MLGQGGGAPVPALRDAPPRDRDGGGGRGGGARDGGGGEARDGVR